MVASFQLQDIALLEAFLYNVHTCTFIIPLNSLAQHLIGNVQLWE